jgi:hypothetical protein
MSNSGRRAIWFAAALVLLWGAGAAAQEIGLFTGEGEASLAQLNPNAARDKAVSAALVQAVEAALPRVAPPEEVEAKREEFKRRLLPDPLRFVVSYTVLGETTANAGLRVSVEARVRLELVREELRAIQVLPKKASPSPVLLLAPYFERPGGLALAADLERALRERFDLASQPLAPAAAAEELLGSPTLTKALREKRWDELAKVAAVKGWRLAALIAVEDQTPEDQRAAACDARATVRLIDAAAGAQIDSLIYRLPTAAPCERQWDRAGKDLFAAIVDSLGKKGRLAEAAGAPLTVEVLGVGDFERLQHTLKTLASLPYVRRVEMVAFEPGGRVRFAVVYAGSGAQLAEALGGARVGGFVLKPLGQKGNLWQFSLEER